jgi:aryl carrier-like protein
MPWSTEVREESLNVTLAELLAERGLKALGEVILKKRPDVLLDVNGVRIILEGKKPGKRNELVAQAENRLDEGMCDVCVMIEYAQVNVRTLEATQKDVKEALVNGRFNVAFMTLADRVGLEKWIEGIKARSKNGFQEDVDFQDLVTYLMAVYEQAVREDVLGPVVEKLDARIHSFARNISSGNINMQRLREALDLRGKE